jgi:drug/metabolite transporter (DMT)-like permease
MTELSWQARFAAISPAGRAMIWAAASGLLFSLLNATMRAMTLQLSSFQVQFLRYAFGLLVLMPIVFKTGFAAYRPNGLSGQIWRGVVHTIGLMLWFAALPHLSMADSTAIGFTTPIFIMFGAVLMLGEKMVWARWVAAAVGFAGMLVIMGPKMNGAGGWWMLVMFAASPVFAGSFLITKFLTRRDSPAVIVFWQSLTVTFLTLPLAVLNWSTLTPLQWGIFLFAGVLGSAGHWSLTNSYRLADISATQSLKFLDLVWASLLGFMMFGDIPTSASLLGGVMVCGATVWIARWEAGRRTAVSSA